MAKNNMKLKYKTQKRQRNKASYEKNTKDEIKSFLITVVMVCGFMGAVYLGVLGMEKLGVFDAGYTPIVKDETKIDYEFISMGTVLNRPEKSYYVLFDNYKSTLTHDSYVNDLLKKQDSYRVYKVDMSKKENEKYISDKENSKAQKVSDIKINGVTLIKVSSGKIVKYVSGSENIEEFLK